MPKELSSDTGHRINELENGPSSYPQKGIFSRGFSMKQ